MKAVTHLLTQNGIAYNGLLLYGLMFPPSVFAVYIMGSRIEKLLTRIDRRLRRI